MKRIGVLSDTHIPKAAPDIPQVIYDSFRDVDIILHAGDFVEMALLKKLKKMAPTHAVRGNMDTFLVAEALPEKDIINVGGFRIGLIHGYGPPSKIIQTVSKEFTRVDAIVFGHSHMPFCEKLKKTLFFNPGTPTDKIFATQNTYGIIEVGEEITGRIIRL